MKPKHAYWLKLVVIPLGLAAGTYELAWILQYHGIGTRLAVFLAITKIGAATGIGALGMRIHYRYQRGETA